MAYQTLPLPFIATRIRERYMGDEPVACGALIVADGQDAGMAIWGIKDFERTANERVETVRGINISAWLLKQHRNKGFARELGRDVVEMAQAQIQNANVPTWSGRQIWTSVHVENTASRLACLGAGFVEAGDHTGSPGRLLYVLGED
jgi:RimJ/RimL family protein N-acetyltransferase